MTDSSLHIPPLRKVTPVASQGSVRHVKRPAPDLMDVRPIAVSPTAAAFPSDIGLPQRPLYRSLGKRALDILAVLLMAPVALVLIGLASVAKSLDRFAPFAPPGQEGIVVA